MGVLVGGVDGRGWPQGLELYLGWVVVPRLGTGGGVNAEKVNGTVLCRAD